MEKWHTRILKCTVRVVRPYRRYVSADVSPRTYLLIRRSQARFEKSQGGTGGILWGTKFRNCTLSHCSGSWRHAQIEELMLETLTFSGCGMVHSSVKVMRVFVTVSRRSRREEVSYRRVMWTYLIPDTDSLDGLYETRQRLEKFHYCEQGLLQTGGIFWRSDTRSCFEGMSAG
jgi:hypothetical protein